MQNNIFMKAFLTLRNDGPFIFAKKTLKFIKLRFLDTIDKIIKIVIFSYAYIPIKANKFESINEILDFSYNLKGLIKPMQVRQEIYDLLNILKEDNLENILEIGTANGGTLFLFSRISNKNAKIISLDLPKGKWGGGYSKWRAIMYKTFSLENQNIYLLRKDSHDKKSLDEVKKILKKEKLDLLFIDGDHSYEGAKLDFDMYSPLVKKDGYVVFHDIVPDLSDTGVGVPDFWQNMKNDYEYTEIVKDWNQGGYGIGLIKNK